MHELTCEVMRELTCEELEFVSGGQISGTTATIALTHGTGNESNSMGSAQIGNSGGITTQRDTIIIAIINNS